ncbi:MAG: hypothetical protein H6739_16030 [Alphaproteobacteria bacterium]|nr:hypothetical protein [Alphaproteobacteria bacterium]
MTPNPQGVRPLPVDPAVLACIRPMEFRDAARVAELHHAAMGSSLWARLGVRFLAELYRGLVEDRRFLGFVFEEDGHVGGFIAGSTDAAAMMQAVFRARWFLLGPAALPGVLARPGVLRHLVQTARYFAVSQDDALDVPAESLFCSFEPALRGRRIAGLINKVLFDDLLARGHRYVKITTETDNEGANRQLRSWGFEDRGTFTFYGKEMVRYVLDLEASPRVEPALRHPTV